jgi:hypothetical protein
MQLSTLGLPVSAQDLLPKLQSIIIDKVRADWRTRQMEYAKDQIRIATRQFFNHELGYKPVTEVHLLN